jgi:hypothetical protein
VRQSCSNAAVACSESRRPAARTTLQCVVVKFELDWGFGMLVQREVSPSPGHGSTREQDFALAKALKRSQVEPLLPFLGALFISHAADHANLSACSKARIQGNNLISQPRPSETAGEPIA